jgi:hypothetical protein
VGEADTRGEGAAMDRGNIHDINAPSGWVTTQQAARALDIQPRTVRWHIEQGNLEAKPEGEGVKRTWLVSIDSLHAFRDARQAAGELPRGRRGAAEDVDIAAEERGSAIRELADRLVEEAARASEFRVRLELTEQAASTVRAQLEEERRRREEVERERDELRRELEALREMSPREAPVSPGPKETSTGASGGPLEPSERPQEPVRVRARSWWKRYFGASMVGLMTALGVLHASGLELPVPTASEPRSAQEQATATHEKPQALPPAPAPEPAPSAPEPVPATKVPVPATKPTPVAEQPTPVAEQPTPVIEEPAPTD